MIIPPLRGPSRRGLADSFLHKPLLPGGSVRAQRTAALLHERSNNGYEGGTRTLPFTPPVSMVGHCPAARTNTVVRGSTVPRLFRGILSHSTALPAASAGFFSYCGGRKHSTLLLDPSARLKTFVCLSFETLRPRVSASTLTASPSAGASTLRRHLGLPGTRRVLLPRPCSILLAPVPQRREDARRGIVRPRPGTEERKNRLRGFARPGGV